MNQRAKREALRSGSGREFVRGASRASVFCLRGVVRRRGSFGVLKGVGIWLGSRGGTHGFPPRPERSEWFLETFYVLCEVCSCPLPTPPQLNIQISRRDSLVHLPPLSLSRSRCFCPLDRPLRARPRNEKKDTHARGPREILS